MKHNLDEHLAWIRRERPYSIPSVQPASRHAATYPIIDASTKLEAHFGPVMPKLLSARMKSTPEVQSFSASGTVSSSASSAGNRQRNVQQQAVPATYITPSVSAIVPNQRQTVNLDSPDAPATAAITIPAVIQAMSAAKRGPSSPHKPKSPAKRLTLHVPDSDAEDEDLRLDDDADYLAFMEGEAQKDIELPEEEPPSYDEEDIPVLAPVSAPQILAASKVRAQTNTPVPQVIPVQTPVLSSTPSIIVSAASAEQEAALASLGTEILECCMDPARGQHCADAQRLIEKRRQIQLTVHQQRIKQLEEAMVACCMRGEAVAGALVAECAALREQVQQLQAQSALSISSAVSAPAALNPVASSRLNQLPHMRASSPLAQTVRTEPAKLARQLFPQPTEVESEIIAIDSDQESFDRNMHGDHAAQETDAFELFSDFGSEEIDLAAQEEAFNRFHQSAQNAQSANRRRKSATLEGFLSQRPAQPPPPHVVDVLISSSPDRWPPSGARPRQPVQRLQTIQPRAPPLPPVDLMSLPGMQHPWSMEVKTALTTVFKLQQFRPHQLDAINATLSGRDCFVLMPTGGGKSLCYQLPSIVNGGATRGTTIVVSPLVSLMQDQVDHLNAVGIRAVAYNSDRSASEKADIRRDLFASGDEAIKCLYVTPELLAVSDTIISTFKKLHEQQSLARIVIDEAHCVSQWGHDFRPDYKKLGDFRAEFPGVPVIALTATANDRVQADVKLNLGLDRPAFFKQSFNRPNLEYQVIVRTKGSITKLLELLNGPHKGQVGIVYCLSKKSCEELSQKLPNSAYYHAGLDKADRAQVQRDWQAGKVRIIVATIAFGMGIDKSNVRWVIHWSLPKSLEGYYQETGRAGRDGEPAMCYLFWTFADKQRLTRMIDDPASPGTREQKAAQKQGIQRMVDYAENKADCRRAQVLGFFSERFDPALCNKTCDNCQSGQVYSTVDVAEAARRAMLVVQQILSTDEDKATLLDCANVFMGRKLKRLTDMGWCNMPSYNGIRHLNSNCWDQTNVERLFRMLESEGAIGEKHISNRMGFTNSYVKLGMNAGRFLEARGPVMLRIQSPRQSRKDSTAERNHDFSDIEEAGEPAQRKVTGRGSPKRTSRTSLQNFLYNGQTAASSSMSSASGAATIAASARAAQAPAAKTTAAAKPRAPITRESNELARFGRVLSDEERRLAVLCHAELIKERDRIKKEQDHRYYTTTFDDAQLYDFSVRLPENSIAMKKIVNVQAKNVDLYGHSLLTICDKYKKQLKQLSGVAPAPAKKNTATGAGKARASAASSAVSRRGQERPNYSEPNFNQEAEDDAMNYGDIPDDVDEQMTEQSGHFVPQQHQAYQQPDRRSEKAKSASQSFSKRKGRGGYSKGSSGGRKSGGSKGGGGRVSKAAGSSSLFGAACAR
ncbi:hypothetical protein BCR37DRAFT_371254 [Protomyces lactucae-debilis]|uniref:DNA 3'-5' helicase n=1 Tax=Protomyces lactucae-debilis TaxID=2754530 RepID=A0A1Y2F0I3_PROLT|nr:uncharacterized protein BCR37DRAFT_371254 [Protomyces lactucae-debilis]ORY77411.1 hypothetical protein BCR37DRAFT_371254 [Protomyces lactucae-debilis]